VIVRQYAEALSPNSEVDFAEANEVNEERRRRRLSEWNFLNIAACLANPVPSVPSLDPDSVLE
jgi:hypothetical protein